MKCVWCSFILVLLFFVGAHFYVCFDFLHPVLLLCVTVVVSAAVAYVDGGCWTRQLVEVDNTLHLLSRDDGHRVVVQQRLLINQSASAV
jgi:hypothetical protein